MPTCIEKNRMTNKSAGLTILGSIAVLVACQFAPSGSFGFLGVIVALLAAGCGLAAMSIIFWRIIDAINEVAAKKLKNKGR